MSTYARSVSEMDALIDSELQLLAQRHFGEFRAAGAFLFLYDTFEKLLEPAFNSTGLGYHQLGYVSTSVDSEPYGIASIAFEDGYAFSQIPEGDKRLDDDAQQQRISYAIRGSMMALRIDAADERIGVLVVYSDEIADVDSAGEQRALKALRADLADLTTLLHGRCATAAERDVARYSELVLDSLRSEARATTVDQVKHDGVSQLKHLFDADSVYLHVTCPDGTNGWYPPPTPAQESALDSICDWNRDAACCVLNRPHSNPQVYATLKATNSGQDHAWCRATVVRGPISLTCVISRDKASFSDHWTQRESTLLCRSLELIQVQIRRALEFDRLVQNVSRVDADVREQQFAFWCYLLRDYFGIDQVLITRVCRKADHYWVKTRLSSGFGDHDDAVRKHPKKYTPPLSERGDCPDVMVRILADYLADNDHASDVYVADCDAPTLDRFCLDETIVSGCQLRGEILFVPCYTYEHGTQRRTLKSIMHLGSQLGLVKVPREQYPLLLSLGVRVADWLSAEDRREADKLIKSVRDNAEASLPAMKSMASAVTSMTHSLGCSMFVNALHVKLLGVSGVTTENLESLFIKLFQAYSHWTEFFDEKTSLTLLRMFSEFFGVPVDTLRTMIASPDRNELARVVAHVVYVRVAHVEAGDKSTQVQSIDNYDATSAVNDLCDLAAKHGDLSDWESAEAFGSFLTRNSYLPGYGLTGWVLRYHHPLRVADKSESSLAKTLKSGTFQAGATWKQPILDVLGYLGIDPALSAVSNDPGVVPEHADHVTDHRKSGRDDSFLAHPIEGFGFSELPAGVIRISGASSMRREFDVSDADVLASVSRHIANVLRTEHLRQRSYLEDVLSQRGDDADFRHVFTRLDEGIGMIREELLNTDGVMTFDDQLPSTVERLQELCDKALARDDQRAIALNVRNAEDSQWTCRMFADSLVVWLDAAKLSPRITTCGNHQHASINKTSVVYMFRTVEEIVRNLLRHQKVEGVCIWVAESGHVYVSGDSVGDVESACAEWHPYRKLYEGAGRGGGAKVLADANASAGVTVDYGIPTDAEEERSMIVRIGPGSQEGITI